MDFTEYRQRGKEMVDYIADYLENIRDRRVYPDVKPGYMKNLLPDSAPIEGENWDTIFSDVNRVIMPGITHWQSPHMHAYFPALNSFPSLLGDMLADAINCIGFTWASSPACTELEIIVMNWLGKMINLPDDFLHLNSASRGGGVIQTTASEATLVCLLAGRTRAIQRFHEKRPGFQDAEINARLVAYCSDQAHSSVEKAALIGLVRMRYIEADENLSMRGQLLREAIEDDIRQGLVPFWVCATLGTTGSCSFDNLEEVGSVCREFNLWLHVDAAYAGSAFICPEFRTWLKGIEKVDSIAFNPSKWLMIHFDATALWVKDSTAVHRTFNVEPLYLQHENSGVAIDFMHWQIPLSRRFRALKIWFVLRSFGIKGLQRHIREGVRLAQKFEALVLADHRFEIPAKRHLGLVVFRIKGENEITERLLKRLNHRGNLHCIPSSLKGKYVIRFTVTSTHTTVDDILRDWMEIKNSATAILDEMNITISNRVYLKDTKEKCEGFGSSLLLSNSPMSPKIVNGSFAALFDADEFLAKTYAGIRITHQDSPSMRRRVRGILMSGKQFSLDSHMDVVVQTSMVSSTTNSAMTDSYGKTAGNMKNKKHESDAICEDEESPEDCGMNWKLNTALQLNPHQYLAVFNRPNRTPIDVIHRQNNLSLFTTFLNKYEVNNYTRSVNSVRTPLTQYQLYKIPSNDALDVGTSNNNTFKQNDCSNLYPGKRFLNMDLSLHNVTSFTDTIFNLPTPTEEIIPIIITEGTPTTCCKTIEDIEDLNKLRPPISTGINNLLISTEKTSKKPQIPKKPAILSETLSRKSITARTTKPVSNELNTKASTDDSLSNHCTVETVKPPHDTLDSNSKDATNEDTISLPSFASTTASMFSILNETTNPKATTTIIKSAGEILNSTTTNITPITNSDTAILETTNTHGNCNYIPEQPESHSATDCQISNCCSRRESFSVEKISFEQQQTAVKTTTTNLSNNLISNETLAEDPTVTTTTTTNTDGNSTTNLHTVSNFKPNVNSNMDSILLRPTTLRFTTVLQSKPSETLTEVCSSDSQSLTATTTTTIDSITKQFNPKMSTSTTSADIDLILDRTVPHTKTSNTQTPTSHFSLLNTTADSYLNTNETSIEILKPNPTNLTATLTTDLSSNTTTIKPLTLTAVTINETTKADQTKTINSSLISNETTTTVATNLFQTLAANSLTANKNQNDIETETEEVKYEISQEKLIKSITSKKDSSSYSLSSDSNETSESIRQPSSDSEGSLVMDLK